MTSGLKGIEITDSILDAEIIEDKEPTVEDLQKQMEELQKQIEEKKYREEKL